MSQHFRSLLQQLQPFFHHSNGATTLAAQSAPPSTHGQSAIAGTPLQAQSLRTSTDTSDFIGANIKRKKLSHTSPLSLASTATAAAAALPSTALSSASKRSRHDDTLVASSCLPLKRGVSPLLTNRKEPRAFKKTTATPLVEQQQPLPASSLIAPTPSTSSTLRVKPLQSGGGRQPSKTPSTVIDSAHLTDSGLEASFQAAASTAMSAHHKQRKQRACSTIDKSNKNKKYSNNYNNSNTSSATAAAAATTTASTDIDSRVGASGASSCCIDCLARLNRRNELINRLQQAYVSYVRSNHSERCFAHIPMLVSRSFRPSEPAATQCERIAVRKGTAVNALFINENARWVYVKTATDAVGFVPTKCCEPFQSLAPQNTINTAVAALSNKSSNTNSVDMNKKIDTVCCCSQSKATIKTTKTTVRRTVRYRTAAAAQSSAHSGRLSATLSRRGAQSIHKRIDFNDSYTDGGSSSSGGVGGGVCRPSGASLASSPSSSTASSSSSLSAVASVDVDAYYNIAVNDRLTGEGSSSYVTISQSERSTRTTSSQQRTISRININQDHTYMTIVDCEPVVVDNTPQQDLQQQQQRLRSEPTHECFPVLPSTQTDLSLFSVSAHLSSLDNNTNNNKNNNNTHILKHKQIKRHLAEQSSHASTIYENEEAIKRALGSRTASMLARFLHTTSGHDDYDTLAEFKCAKETAPSCRLNYDTLSQCKTGGGAGGGPADCHYDVLTQCKSSSLAAGKASKTVKRRSHQQRSKLFRVIDDYVADFQDDLTAHRGDIVSLVVRADLDAADHHMDGDEQAAASNESRAPSATAHNSDWLLVRMHKRAAARDRSHAPPSSRPELRPLQQQQQQQQSSSLIYENLLPVSVQQPNRASTAQQSGFIPREYLCLL